jgi:Bacterial PH domain
MSSAQPASPNSQDVNHPRQAVTGVVPPQVAEAVIREVCPSVIGSALGAPVGRLAQLLSDTIVLRPLAWLLLLPLFVGNLVPFLAKRYRLTNRRLIVLRFGTRTAAQEIPLADIETVRMEPGSFNTYFRAATLEVVSKGQVALRLLGVRDPESFRLAVLNACNAWAPTRPKGVMPPDKDMAVQGAR